MSVTMLEQISPRELAGLDMRPRATIQVRRIDLPESIQFFRDADDLDMFEAAALKSDPGSGQWVAHYAGMFDASVEDMPGVSLVFLLLRYEREPREQWTVFLPDTIDGRDNVTSAIGQVISALHLTSSAVVDIFAVTDD